MLAVFVEYLWPSFLVQQHGQGGITSASPHTHQKTSAPRYSRMGFKTSQNTSDLSEQWSPLVMAFFKLPQFPYNRTPRQPMEPAEWSGKQQQLGTTVPHVWLSEMLCGKVERRRLHKYGGRSADLPVQWLVGVSLDVESQGEHRTQALCSGLGWISVDISHLGKLPQWCSVLPPYPSGLVQ